MRYVFSFCFAFLFFGCTNAVPVVTSSTSSFSAPTFSNTPGNTFYLSSYNSSVTISGECHILTQSFEMSTDGTTWSPVPTAGADLNCLDGRFSFVIPDASSSGVLGASGFTVSSVAGDLVSFQIRGQSYIQTTSDVTVVSLKLSSLSQKLAGINSGGGLMAGTNYRIYSQIGRRVSAHEMASASYRIKIKGAN